MTHAATNIELVVFDLGNVLVTVDEQRAVGRISQLSGRDEDLVWSTIFAPAAKRAVETGAVTWDGFAAGVVAELGGDLNERHFRDAFNRVLRPIAEVFPLVEEVRLRRPIALCSNTSPAHWEYGRTLVPFSEAFDPVIVSYEAGYLKPEREIFDYLIERCPVPAGRILFFDDYEENVQAARSAGINAERFTGADTLRADLVRYGVLAR